MLNKIFGNKKPNGLSTNSTHAQASAIKSGPVERDSRALKIVHPGGHAEYHYMAIPAAMILEKHPSFVLARPEIFRRPWEPIIRPDEILTPGQKYYVVPRRTVKKLRRRIRKTSTTRNPLSLEDSSQHEMSSLSISGILVKPGPKVKARNLHVSFFGVETANQKRGSDQVHVHPSDKTRGNTKAEKGAMDEKKRRARNVNAWEPSLGSISES